MKNDRSERKDEGAQSSRAALTPQTGEEVRGSFWRSGLASLLGLAVFVALVGLIPQPSFEGIPLLAVGIVLALVPALLWLVFFYQQDRKEPEPKRVVFRVFLFGALMASGAGEPILSLFGVDQWIHGSAWLRLVGLIVVVGFTQEFFKYAAVRYTVFPTGDFGSRVDGIIYGVAAGLGYATALNLSYVFANEGVVLFVGSLQMVDTALAQAGFAAVTCYFLAGARHGDRPVWWVPAGMALAATLNGVFAFLRREVTVQGLTFKPLNALFLSIAFVAVALGILFFMLRRAERRTTGGDLQEEARGHAE